MNRPTSTLLALATTFVFAPAALADTIHVPADAPTIQAGIDLALPGDVVVVGDGVWAGNGNRDLTLPPFDLVVTSENGPRNCTIFSNGSPENPHRAFTIDGPHTRATVVSGFTIRGGDTLTGAISDQFNAGGILIHDGSPTIEDCQFINNDCSCWGGAICISGLGDPRVTRCFFFGNHSDAEGGAFFSFGGGNPVIDNCVFQNNTSGVAGGAIFSFNPLRIENVTVVDNWSDGNAGGIWGSQLTLTNSIVWGNDSANGSAFNFFQSEVTFSNVQGGHEGEGNIALDPKFKADGWRIRTMQSPCRDAGDPNARLGRSDVDFDGDSRLRGLRIDMGADEGAIFDLTPR